MFPRGIGGGVGGAKELQLHFIFLVLHRIVLEKIFSCQSISPS